MKLAASSPEAMKAWPATPMSVIHESAGGMRQRMFIPSFNKKATIRKTPVPGRKERTSLTLVAMEGTAFNLNMKIPCAENTNGIRIQIKRKEITM